MGTKTIVICDNCGDEIGTGRDNYSIKEVRKQNQIVFRSNSYAIPPGEKDWQTIELDLCSKCCKNIVDTLKELVQAQNDEGSKD